MLTDIGSRTAILKVAVSLSTDVARDTDGCAPVSDTARESTNMASLVSSSQPEVVILAINSNVLIMPLSKLLYRSFNGLHASRLAHLLGGVVSVTTCTVPVTLERLGMEGDLDAPLLGNTNQEITGHPEVVTHRDTFTGTNLELPLRGHDFGIDTGDIDASIKASPVVRFNQVTGKDLAGT
jgi:hypothetical protein